MAVSVRRVRYIEMMLPWILTSRHSIDVAAAAASISSAHAKTMAPLRVAAIVGNILAMAYSFMLGTYLIFMLNTALLALHGWRLRAMLNLIRDIDVATGSDMNVDWLLPYTRPKHFKADDVMMERGEYAKIG